MDTGVPVSLIVETTLTLLLAATLVCCILVERRLRFLRKDQDKLAQTVRSLNGAIAAARASLSGLRAAASEADATLGRKVGMARNLADELSVLASAGERIAERMEAAHEERQRRNPPQLRAMR